MYDACMYLGMYICVRMRPKELILDPLLPLSPPSPFPFPVPGWFFAAYNREPFIVHAVNQP